MLRLPALLHLALPRVSGPTLVALLWFVAPGYAQPASAPAGTPALFFPAVEASPAAAGSMMQPIPSRTVELTTVLTLPPSSETARVWMPIPLQSSVQQVIELAVQAPAAWTIEREQVHGNRFLYAAVPPSKFPTIVRWTAVVKRREWVGPEKDDTSPEQLATYRQATALVPVGGDVLGPRTREVVARTGPVPSDQAHGVFEYVRAELEYAKDTNGWGRGDALYACEAKRGNCTDYHSLFNGMVRTAGIPARFTMGLALPAGRSGDIAGYHCWTAYWLDGAGWIPADVSESDKHPEAPITNYLSRLDEHRIAISRGRDVVLAPAQDGPPLNYVWDPYVEVNGQAADIAPTRRTYRDLSQADLIFRKAVR